MIEGMSDSQVLKLYKLFDDVFNDMNYESTVASEVHSGKVPDSAASVFLTTKTRAECEKVLMLHETEWSLLRDDKGIRIAYLQLFRLIVTKFPETFLPPREEEGVESLLHRTMRAVPIELAPLITEILVGFRIHYLSLL